MMTIHRGQHIKRRRRRSTCMGKQMNVLSLLSLLLFLLLPVVVVVNGFATYLLSRSGCMTDLDTTEVIMNSNVILQQPSDDEDEGMQLVLNQPNESLILIDNTIWINPEKSPLSFPLTLNLQLLPAADNNNKKKKKKNKKDNDYQFVMETALFDASGEVQETNDNIYTFFPKGSCEKHKRVAGRGNVDIISLIISKEPPSSDSGNGGGVAVWAGWASGHEAVTISQPYYIRIMQESDKETILAKQQLAAVEAVEAERKAAAAQATTEQKAEIKDTAETEASSSSSSSWSDFIMSDIGCASIIMSQDEPLVIQERRVLAIPTATLGNDGPVKVNYPVPTLHLKVIGTPNEIIDTATDGHTIFEFNITATNSKTEEHAAAASNSMLPKIIVLDVAAAGHAAWQSISSSNTAITTISCGGRRIKIIVQQQEGEEEATSFAWPVVRLTLTMPTSKNDGNRQGQDNEDWLLLQHGIFIRGVYEIATSKGHDDENEKTTTTLAPLYKTTTLDLSWKPDDENDSNNNKTKAKKDDNNITEPDVIAYKELLKQQHVTAHHEPRGQGIQQHGVKGEKRRQQQQQDNQNQHDRTIDVVVTTHKKEKDEQAEELRKHQKLLALQDANAPRVLEEPSERIIRTIPDRHNHQQQYEQQQQQLQEHDGQAGLRRRINSLFNKGSIGHHRHRRTAVDDPVEAFVHGKESYFWGIFVWIVGMLIAIQGCRQASKGGHGSKGRRDL